MEGMNNACEYAGISNALSNTAHNHGSAMYGSTPQTAMPRLLCEVLCEYAGISNALFNTPLAHNHGSAMHCSTPYTTMDQPCTVQHPRRPWISNALFKTLHNHGSAMDCSTPHTTMDQQCTVFNTLDGHAQVAVCAVFTAQITSLRNGFLTNTKLHQTDRGTMTCAAKENLRQRALQNM